MAVFRENIFTKSHQILYDMVEQLVYYPIISIQNEYDILILHFRKVENLRQRINNYKHDFKSLYSPI